MKVSLEENKAVLDDKLEITPDGNGYRFAYPGMFGNFVTIAEPLGTEVDTSRISRRGNGSYAYKEDTVKYDPHYYLNGHNNLTVEESTERAFQYVYEDQLRVGLDIDRTWPGMIKDAIRVMIERGDGRHDVYRTAGVIIRNYKRGMYEGVPFSVVFQAVANRKMFVG